ERFKDTPKDYFEAFKNAKINNVPVLLLRGKNNKVFSDSNEQTYKELESKRKNVFYKCFSDYGHMDVFMGVESHKDVFPTITAFTENKRLEV
ncbi:hypothetical protein N9W79_01750, partial [bacterium]|nr:hypothetical protein [bacterium]